MSLYAVTNPATGETVKAYPTATDEQIHAAVATADAAFRAWNRTALADRVKLLGRVAELYTERRDELAAIVTREMGKPVFQAQIEVDIVASIYRYYAENGPSFLEDEELEVAAGGTAIVRKDGLGVLLGIMPWNFPYYQVARFAAPNLMNGNTILLKHAPQCPESALAVEQIFRDAGAPEGAYLNLFATNGQVADIIADPRVQGVSLTGSERAGSAVAEIAGRNLKKVVLELGGSDPFLVLDSADLDQAATHALLGRFGNTGQACNAAKRIIVADAVYDLFVEKFVSAVTSMKVGDPTEADTFMGPLSSTAALDGLAAQVDDAVAKGATVLTGGGRLDQPGAWFQPTVLAGVTEDMRAFSEELFGPVAVLYRVSSEDEAVELANNSVYGLGAVIQSTDPAKAAEIADRLETGMVYINEAPGSAAELPFGGIKRSGVGRELGKYGMDEFVNRKLIRTAK
ncbi:succinate-semialdehyde dehydrogenase/glutarate-semialdehyde dehydrogenase [Arthrobacter ginsengisoli]|uniref:Succinate-semialdehyde dehydrogenase/glutarate-semialdehyde dehydrogenase n=1 Tax=Arthrobacter ginsengisoli TaxID=1356565 RepID=A0ABU1UG65_9MICC|nr:NAD-dependent succinate-semialdehyde dehydrogenase [Arthrobacter ginsengisoli]MDR7084174.1 succinate-semialdehyde dehydrogenase/glutarate-semialdehyde dehydrogenase [Arthrobacter ginsengisoli]